MQNSCNVILIIYSTNIVKCIYYGYCSYMRKRILWQSTTSRKDQIVVILKNLFKIRMSQAYISITRIVFSVIVNTINSIVYYIILSMFCNFSRIVIIYFKFIFWQIRSNRLQKPLCSTNTQSIYGNKCYSDFSFYFHPYSISGKFTYF